MALYVLSEPSAATQRHATRPGKRRAPVLCRTHPPRGKVCLPLTTPRRGRFDAGYGCHKGPPGPLLVAVGGAFGLNIKKKHSVALLPALSLPDRPEPNGTPSLSFGCGCLMLCRFLAQCERPPAPIPRHRHCPLPFPPGFGFVWETPVATRVFLSRRRAPSGPV